MDLIKDRLRRPTFWYLILILLIMGMVGNMDFQEEQHQAEQYCEMVRLWKETRGQAGWPAYNGEGACRAALNAMED